jgi:hypothetical protein
VFAGFDLVYIGLKLLIITDGYGCLEFLVGFYQFQVVLPPEYCF